MVYVPALKRSGNPKTAIVTGGAGFIGSHLVDRLLADGHRVTVLDDLSTGRAANLAHLKGHPQLGFHQVAVDRHDDVAPLLRGADWVFHLAALADIVPSIDDPLRYYRANVTGTVSVIEAARKAGVKRFVYAASSSCYGIPDVFPTPEDAPTSPMYPYALTKLLGEQAVQHWNAVYKMPTISLRLFNVYGPRSRTTGAYGAVFGVFLAQKLAGKPFTIVGDGSQTRDFTFVTDVAEAMVQAAGSTVENEVFNVGSGKPNSVNRLADLLGGDRVYIPKRPGEPDRTEADVTRIAARLGWHARVSFEEGVRIMLGHIRDWRDAPVWDPQTIAVATRSWFSHLGGAQPGAEGE